MVETRAGASPDLGTRILSAIIVTKYGTSKGTVFYGRRRVKTKGVSRKRRIMMIVIV